jgi:hypothetical protein
VLVLHLHQHESSRNLHLHLAKNQSTQCCQSLITQGSDHPPILEPHMVLKIYELQEGNQQNYGSFHTLGGQILYKAVKKIYAYGAMK